MKGKLMHWFTIIAYSSLYILVSIISMIHVVTFFGMSNNIVMATSLAVAFELGCAASLVSAVSKNQMNQFIVWSLFIILTAFQMMGNTFFAYSNLHDFTSWTELFGMVELDVIEQKRYLSIISGAILPVVALGYIKCLVDYLTKYNSEKTLDVNDEVENEESVVEEESSSDKIEEIVESVEENKEVIPEQIIGADENEDIHEAPKKNKKILSIKKFSNQGHLKYKTK